MEDDGFSNEGSANPELAITYFMTDMSWTQDMDGEEDGYEEVRNSQTVNIGDETST